jgi:phosphoribosylformylglycinamidine synthase
MDPAAQSVREAIQEMFDIDVRVSTGTRYDVSGASGEHARGLATRLLANPVIHAIHTEPLMPDELARGHARAFEVTRIPIRDLDDAALERMSRDAHLFLSLEEMRAIQAEFRRLEREPTDIELETLAQTWSEHCVHKTLKSRVKYTMRDGAGPDRIDWTGRPGHTVDDDGTVTIDNLLKSTVAAATHELIADGLDWTLSVFVDNAGIIAFDDRNAVCVKVETHNHPSAIEPYGGAATGVGGCIRDIIGTGLAAKPIANTDVFCVAPADMTDVPAGCLHPRRILSQVVAGVRDYGNRMGIPTVNGAVAFDERYVGNPLVFCGCVGVMPRELIRGDAKPGDLIVALGGRTGRDGIHGATFSSAELTDTHADEFSHAVQIGNPIEEKRLLDAILRARDAGPLYHAITDCGAGGFSSAVGEMGEQLGADVHLDRAPLKYDGLSYTEIWISEAQERMVLAVPEARLADLQRICDEEHVELAVLGTFGTPNRELILNYQGAEVGRIPMAFLHDGLPTSVREATWTHADLPDQWRDDDAGSTLQGAAPPPPGVKVSPADTSIKEALLELLAHPDVASKHWIIRQYDHEVQGNLVAKPLVGAHAVGPGDASVIEPVPGTGRGLAIGCGLATGIGDPRVGGDPYLMALAAIDECVRNLVCLGADPERIAILDNFCWPSCRKPQNLGALVRAAEGCYDGAKAYRTPFVSGKDSLNNQFTTEAGQTIEIPPTLLITGIGIVPDIRRVVTMDAKRPGNTLILVSPTGRTASRNAHRLGGSRFASRFGIPADASAAVPRVDLDQGPRVAALIAGLIRDRLIESVHDVSDGGVACAIAEMLIAGSTHQRPIGAAIHDLAPTIPHLFGEAPSTYLLEARPEHVDAITRTSAANASVIGHTTDTGTLELAHQTTVGVDELTMAWRTTLDW